MKRVISLFSGVGGIDYAFIKNGYKIVFANDFDENSVKTYNCNFETKSLLGDITKIDPKTLPNADVLIGGFPCQPFSVAGYRKGFADTRGTLFFNIIEILKEKQPEIIFLENVKNLETHDHGETLKVILASLKKLAYFVKYKVLNASKYGNMPQNRERIYIVGFKNKSHYYNFSFPETIPLTKRITDVIDFNNKVENKYYYTYEKYPRILDAFKNMSPQSGVIYQWRRIYLRENKSGVCPCLTANMGTGGHNVPLVYTKYGLRKLTPRECFLIQGFPEDFKLPQLQTPNYISKQATACVSE